MARGQGVEPRLPGPKPGVLPLDDPRITLKRNMVYSFLNSNLFLAKSQAFASYFLSFKKINRIVALNIPKALNLKAMLIL